MRIIILTLILSTCGFGYAQSTLQINIKDCRDEYDYGYLSEFKVYRNDILIKTIEPKHENYQTLKELEYGDYRIEYKTMFQKTENVKIKLTEKKKYNVALCLNFINYQLESYKSFIDQLENGEKYSIEVSSQGCFHSSDEIIIIKRKEDKYYAFFKKTKKLLKKEDIETIRSFEIELNYMESFGCTSTDSYTLKYKGEMIEISDGSCSWSGYYYLKKKLNIKKE